MMLLLQLGTSNMNISNANAMADFDNLDVKQVSVSSLKCNNINVNANGLELDVLPPFLTDSGLGVKAVEVLQIPTPLQEIVMVLKLMTLDLSV